ncbi:TPA: entericidin A/B family lipoprotein [Serratia fonticola]
MLKKTIFAIFSLLILSSLVGCNTTAGVGKDVEAGGQAIQRSAE